MSITTNTTVPTNSNTYKFADLRKRQGLFIDALINAGYSGESTTRRAVVATAAACGYPDSFPWPSWLTADLARRQARGVFYVPELAERVIARAALGSLPVGYEMLTPGVLTKQTPASGSPTP